MSRTWDGLLSVADTLTRVGAAYIPGHLMRSTLPVHSIERLMAHWDDLVMDVYLPQQATYRTRRYGRLLARYKADRTYSFEALPHNEFQQSAEVVPLYGGRTRTFAPIAASILLSEPLLALVRADLGVIAAVESGTRTFYVGLHMVRIAAPRGEARPPVPEGRHCDGHHYVAMHLVARRQCSGGESLIYLPGADSPFLREKLMAELDTLIVDDRRVEHEVTPIRAIGSGGLRDMLLVDFDSFSDLK
ncbi:2OG-Fe dioxygenase family protein [Amycolatopsis speibonae]|uniref:2OG-Fe dioxygenase family protein n=1 Tax=Amycolatopsis speibonae TaxID=1450224 RepID=A0ABV7NW96_9PSEU